ncbi:MAG: sulfur oxidation c-type cytochrome SoxA, partial [Gammaproteobacteria bacterium]|nr:sulfur oxidation c-type cytochrome SoxA [Gammaproteobacteria bacterium]
MSLLKPYMSALLQMLTLLLCIGSAHALQPISGTSLLSEEVCDMQEDEFANPGMESVERGAELFHTIDDSEMSCAQCHGVDGVKINKKSVAAFPKYSEELQRPITIQDQINICKEERMDNFPYLYDSRVLVDLESYIRNRSRGEVINVKTDGPIKPYYEAGKKLFETRMGQLDMGCVHCHDYYNGQWLRGQQLGQGQSNGFPTYRLSTQRITS